MLSECEFATYGDQCKETCGQCQDLTKCHYKNGTCLTGCKAGYHGVLCKTRKKINCVLYWPIIYILEHIYLKLISSLDLVQWRYAFPLHICGMVWYVLCYGMLVLYYDMSFLLVWYAIVVKDDIMSFAFRKHGLFCYEICGNVSYF